MQCVTCCHNCKERHTACWGDCEKYKAERSEYEARKQAHRERRKLDENIDAILRGKRRK